MKLISILLLLILSLKSEGQTAEEILQKAIAYHDPNKEWSSLKATFIFRETRPSGPDRMTVFKIDNASNKHRIDRDGKEIYEVHHSAVKVVKGDGDAARGKLLRNYYVYLWGLPMKLTDANTTILSEVKTEKFQNQLCHVVTVVYEKETWQFYFLTNKFQMMGYRFDRNDNSGKGEIIVLKGEVIVGNMRIPKERSWYELPGNKFLGTDILERVE